MTRLELSKFWCRLITELLGIPAVRANQIDAPKPEANQFASVLIFNADERGHPEVDWSDLEEDVEESITERIHYTMSVQFFRNAETAPIDAARTFRMYLQSQNAKQILRANQIGLGDIGPINDISFVERTQWEERVQMDIDFNVISVYSSAVLALTSATIGGQIQADGQTYETEG